MDQHTVGRCLGSSSIYGCAAPTRPTIRGRVRLNRTVRSYRKLRSSWPMPQRLHAGPEANESRFCRNRWSNIGSKSKPSTTNIQNGPVSGGRSPARAGCGASPRSPTQIVPGTANTGSAQNSPVVILPNNPISLTHCLICTTCSDPERPVQAHVPSVPRSLTNRYLSFCPEVFQSHNSIGGQGHTLLSYGPL